MPVSKLPIFRDKALKRYISMREHDVLPRVASPPVFTFLWILLGLLLSAGILAWLGQVPQYLAGSGIILHQLLTPQQGKDEAIAVVFLPFTPSLKVHPGLPVQVQIGSTGPHFTGTIEQVKPGVLSPHDARQQYALSSDVSQVITQPSVVVTVTLGSSISARTYAGSSVSAQVQVGTQSVLSLFTGLSSPSGG